VGHASRSGRLLCLKTSCAMVFLSDLKIWRRRDYGGCTWHHHRGYINRKLKMDGSMRWNALEPFIIKSPFLVSLLPRHVNRTLEGWNSLSIL
jgi:hypothetical protein